MIKEDIYTLDETLCLIKQKTRNASFVKFEFYLIMALEIARYELFTFKSLSDTTSEAISQLFSFQAHEIYYRDHPDIYEKSLNLFSILSNYNAKLKTHSLSGGIGVKDKNWIKYFKESITRLIDANMPNNR